MSNQGLLRLGLPLAEKTQNSFFSGLKFGSKGALLGASIVGFEVSQAQRGEKVPSLLGKTIGLTSYPVLSGVATLALCLIPGVGTTMATILGSVLAGYESELLGNSLARKVRIFTNLHKNIRHLEMGGNYQDTELAQRQRFLAIQDMNATRLPSRRYLGQEALLMHR